MNASITVPNALVLVVFFSLVAFVFGNIRMSRYQDERVEWIVGENGRLRSALRSLFAATGYEWPDDADETVLEAALPWWSRTWARVEGMRLRRQVPIPAAEPDVGPATTPDLPAQPGPPTQPQEAVVSRSLQQILDEFRAKADQIEGKAS